mgnify:CR=1 FL=1
MENQAVSGTKKPLFGGRKPLFTQKELLLLTGPLLVEQLLEVTVGMADTMMVSRCGEAAISGVSLVDMINNLIIVLFAALATGGAVVVSQFLGAREQKEADASSGQLLLLSGVFGLLVGAFCLFWPAHDPAVLRCHRGRCAGCQRAVPAHHRHQLSRFWHCITAVRHCSAAWATPRSPCKSAF